MSKKTIEQKDFLTKNHLEGVYDNKLETTAKMVAKSKVVLAKAKETEAKQLKLGYVYVTKAKESKLVHPNKIGFYLDQGYKLNKK